MHKLFLKTIGMYWLCLALFLLQKPALAAPILTLDLDSTTANLAPNDSLIVKGAITNRSSNNLVGTDFILNFANYDPLSVEPNQLLGIKEVTIPSFTFLSDLDLFSISLLPDARPGTFTLDILLQDIYGNFADQVSMLIVVSSNETPVPEPGTLYLIFVCLMILSASRRINAR